VNSASTLFARAVSARDLVRLGGERAPLRGRGPEREQPRRLCFQRFAQLVEVANVRLGRHADPRPGARARFDQAIRLELAQRVADGQQAHPELVGEPAPRERRTGSHLPAQDFLADRVVGLIGEAGHVGGAGHADAQQRRKGVTRSQGTA
jgi:hypothetical protein